MIYLKIQLVVTKEHKFMVTQWLAVLGKRNFWHKYEELLQEVNNIL